MTARGPAAEWLSVRALRVPAAVRGRLVPFDRAPLADATTGGIEVLVQSLCDIAHEALAGAEVGAGEHRGAFELLCADALVTLACEAALAQDDPDRILAEILSRIVS